MTFALRCLALWAIVAASLARSATSAEAPSRVERQLDKRVTLTWQGQRLGEALQRLGETQGVPLWVDRRVDPSVEVTFSANRLPVGRVFAEVAQRQGMAVMPLDDVVYVGPAPTARALPALIGKARNSLAEASPAVRRRWLEPAPWSYPRLSQPRRLLDDLLEPAGIAVVDVHRLPHDLWPARSLPAMPLVDRVVLLLVGFDLKADISAGGQRVRLAPIKYNQLPKTPPPTLSSAVPVADAAPTPTNAEQAYTLKIDKAPVGRVMEQLARQLTLEVHWDESLQTGADTGDGVRVSCDVREVTLDELLEAVLTPAGLAFEREGRTVRIHDAP